MTRTIKTQTEIKQAAIARCTDKDTKEVYYVIQSDTDSDTWYHIRFSHTFHRWMCDCPATKPCKHERAVNEVLAVRRARIAVAMGGETPAIVARLQQDEDKRNGSQLNGRNAGFSLLRR